MGAIMWVELGQGQTLRWALQEAWGGEWKVMILPQHTAEAFARAVLAKSASGFDHDAVLAMEGG